MRSPGAGARPIGFFDSGVGGLTILRAAVGLLPHEHFVYLADNAHFPYGAIAPADLRILATRLASFLIERGCKLIVAACNTATVHTLGHLRATFPDVPFVGVVPVVKTLAERTRTGVIALLSTPATAESAYLSELIARFAADLTVINVACPGLADLVETTAPGHPALAALLEEYLAPVLAAGADVLGLGCTHYPLLRPQIRRILGPGVRIYDSGLPVARRIAAVLAERTDHAAASGGGIALYSTGDGDALARAARRLLRVRHSEVTMGTLHDPVAGSCCYTTRGAK